MGVWKCMQKRLKMNGWNMRKAQTSSIDQPCKHWSCNAYLKSKPVLSFAKNFSRYQNSEILLSLNVIAIIKFVYLYQFTPSLTLDWNFFFYKIAFTLNCWLLYLLECVIVWLKEQGRLQYLKNKGKTKNLNVIVYLLKHITLCISNAPN